MGFNRGGGRSQGRGGSQSKYVRVGNMFESDREYVPENARSQHTTKLDGKYLDAVRDVLNNNDVVRFVFTDWKDGEHPVLSVAPATEGGRRGNASRGGRSGGDRGYGNRSDRGGRGPDRPSRSRPIDDDPQDGQDNSDGEKEPDNNWEK